MSVVRINVLEVPEGGGEELERRFSQRAGEVDKTPGFEAFELLRPTDGSNRYFVYTRWASQEAFEEWTTSQRFQRGHAQAGGGDSSQARPVASGSELLSFDVVLESHGEKQAAATHTPAPEVAPEG